MRHTKELESHPAGSAAAAALYIGALTAELGQLARANGLDVLSYLLDMARLEADEVLKASGPAVESYGEARSQRRPG